MPQEIQVTIKLPGNAERKLELAALAARKFGRPDTVIVDDVSVPNPELPMDYLESYLEQTLSDVLSLAVGEVAANNAAKTEREKPDNQFSKRQRQRLR
jgi:hypothetical protein